jgi:hypothetical protein
MSTWAVRTIRTSVLAVAIASVLPVIATAQTTAVSESGEISVPQFDRHVTEFLGREIGAHVADLRSLNPPQDYVVGARTGGEFSWGTFMRAVASYSALSGDTTLSDKDLEELIGQLGLIEAERGGKTFAQLYAAISLRTFGSGGAGPMAIASRSRALLRPQDSPRDQSSRKLLWRGCARRNHRL